MNLQERTVLVLLITLIGVLSVISVFVSAIYLSSFTSLEHEYVAKDLTASVTALDNEEATLSALVSDWGPWDDTYDFVNGNKPDYIEKNLVPETYSNIQLNLIVITDKTGNIVYSGAYDLRNNTMTAIPDSVRSELTGNSPLLRMNDTRSATTGILVLPENALIFASRPIVHTDFSGTPQGVVIMGRYLDSDELRKLGMLTDPSLNLTRADSPSIPASLLSALKVSGGEIPEVIQPISKDSIGGYALIRDIHGNDALVLSIVQSRDIYTQGIRTTLEFIGIILASGLFLGVVILLFIDRFVLSRIGALSGQVYRIGRDTGVFHRVSLHGNDELSGLATEINRMLETIENTQKKVQASEIRFRELAGQLPLIIFEMDTGGGLTYVNKMAVELFGITEEKISDGVNIRIFLSSDNIGMMERGLARVMSGSKSPGEIYTLQRVDGTVMKAIVYTSLIRREEQVIGFRGIVLDITERLRLEEALAENKEYLETLLATVQIGIVVIDADTFKIVDANPAAVAMLGTTRENLLANVCHRFICPSVDGDCPVIDRGLKIENEEQVLLTCDGRKLSVIKYVVPVILHGKQCLLETFIDNSYRKQIERQLKESEEKYRALTENTPDVLFSSDIDGIVTYVSPQINQYGFLSEEIVGHSLFDLLHPEDRPRVLENFSRELNEHAKFSATFRLTDKWGNVHLVEDKAFLQLDKYGKQQGVYGMLRDITERMRAEEAIELANKKLNLMNNITRHDILNTITGLLGCVDMANATTSAGERTELLADIKDLVRVIQRQISFTKQYQEVGVHLPQWQDVNEVLQRVLLNFESSGIHFAVDIEPIEIFADPLLEKVFYNLVDNALRYGKNVTTIKFYFTISDRGLSLICEDDGIGIPDDYKQHIFDRGVGQNTGMGLFISREILGITRIEIEENGVFGEGARFVMLFPIGAFRFKGMRRQG